MDLDTMNINNPFVSKIQLRLIDTDNLGHISNVAYIAYLETIRTEWNAYVKGSRISLNAGNWDWILGGINIKFIKEAKLSDVISIDMWCSRVGSKSWDFSYAMYRSIDQSKERKKKEIIAIAQTSQICFNYDIGKSKLISEDILKDLNNRMGEPWTDFVQK